MLFLEARPFAVNLPSLYGAPKYKHQASVTVVGSVVTVLLRRAAKLRHGHQNDILHAVAHIGRKGRKRRAKLAQHVVQLVRLVLMMIPATDFRESGFHARIRLDEPRDLLQAAPQFT